MPQLLLLFLLYSLAAQAQDCISRKQWVTLQGQSMKGWANPGDSLLLLHNYYQCHPPISGDFVVFQIGKNNKPPMLKRIIAVPGDTFDVKDSLGGMWWVNHKPVLDPSGNPLRVPPNRKGMVLMYVRQFKGLLPEGMVLVSASQSLMHDSSLFGPIPIKQLLGKAIPATELGP